MPELTPGQIAFHSGLTANPKAFSLAKVTAARRIAEKIADPKNAHLFTKEAAHRAFAHLKEASVARTLADASAALKAGTLRKLAPPPPTALHLQIANDFAVLLTRERGQKAVVQHLYDGIGEYSVALLGVKKCP